MVASVTEPLQVFHSGGARVMRSTAEGGELTHVSNYAVVWRSPGKWLDFSKWGRIWHASGGTVQPPSQAEWLIWFRTEHQCCADELPASANAALHCGERLVVMLRLWLLAVATWLGVQGFGNEDLLSSRSTGRTFSGFSLASSFYFQRSNIQTWILAVAQKSQVSFFRTS